MDLLKRVTHRNTLGIGFKFAQVRAQFMSDTCCMSRVQILDLTHLALLNEFESKSTK